MIDASIPLGVHPVQIEPPINQLAKVLQVQGSMRDNQLGQLKMDEYQRGTDEMNALRNVMGQSGFSWDDPTQRNAAFAAAPLKAEPIYKAHTEGLTAKANYDQKTFQVAKERHDMFQSTLGALAQEKNLTKDMVTQVGQSLVQQGILPAEMYTQSLANMPDDPEQLRARLVQGLKSRMTPDQIFTVFAPKPEKIDNGQQISFTDTNPNSPTYGQPTAGGAVQKVATPDATMTDQRARSEGALNRSQALKLHNDTVANENLRAGVGPGGALDENTERTAQAIASGQLPAPTGMALLNPKNQRILGRVMEINPQYDSTTVDAKKKAARDFTTGSLGNSMRSFQVAGQHLDQLGTLVDALDNKNLQIVNKIGNAYASQTGNPAPTNFEAAKDVVSKEVVKAIVAGGGGVSERQELSHLMDSAKTPAQLKGVIQQYRNLMSAQHDALLQQRRAAGLSDSTLPNYNEAGGGGHAPAMPPMSAIDAELARRAGKKP